MRQCLESGCRGGREITYSCSRMMSASTPNIWYSPDASFTRRRMVLQSWVTGSRTDGQATPWWRCSKSRCTARAEVGREQNRVEHFQSVGPCSTEHFGGNVVGDVSCVPCLERGQQLWESWGTSMGNPICAWKLSPTPRVLDGRQTH